MKEVLQGISGDGERIAVAHGWRRRVEGTKKLEKIAREGLRAEIWRESEVPGRLSLIHI